jgi:hypothetical protein
LNHQSQWDCQKGKSRIFGDLNNKRAAEAALFYIVEVRFPVKILFRQFPGQLALSDSSGFKNL